MQLRYFIECLFLMFITFFFQFYITVFNNYLHASRTELIILKELRALTELDHEDHTAEILEHTEILHHDLKIASFDLFEAMVVCSVQLWFPINMFS